MRFSVSSLLTLAAAATAVVAQPSKRAQSLNPPKAYIHEVKWEELAPASTEPITNAKRFAQGLPPLNPRRRNPNRAVHGGTVHARKGTRVASAPRAETSSLPPVTQKCNIRVQDISSGAWLGFVSREWNSWAEYGPLQSSQDGALEVSFSYSPDSPKQLNLVTTNGKSAAYPYFGAVSGYGGEGNDISPDNSNYLFLVGTTQTAPGATPEDNANNSFSEVSLSEVASQSAIWSYDPLSQALTAEWVNTDGSLAKPDILWSEQEGNIMFTLTGDADLFRSTFGVEAPEVAIYCVSPVIVV